MVEIGDTYLEPEYPEESAGALTSSAALSAEPCSPPPSQPRKYEFEVDPVTGGFKFEDVSDDDSEGEVAAVAGDAVHVQRQVEDQMEAEAEEFGEDSPLRRRDQLAASREDSPARKGRGKGRGGKGRGRGRGKGKKKDEGQDDEQPPTRKRKSQTAAPKAKKSKAPAKQQDGEDTSPRDDQVEEPQAKGKGKGKGRKAKSPKVKKDDKKVEKAAPKRRTKKSQDASVQDVSSGSASAPSAPSAPSAVSEKPQKGVTEKEKTRLKKLIKTFKLSHVVPYWSRAAVGLKVPKPDGGLSQALLQVTFLSDDHCIQRV